MKSPRRWAGLVLALALFLWWIRPYPIANLRPHPGPVVVLGDSLAAGFGSETHRGYVALLQQRLGVELINRGVSGDTTSAGLARLEQDVLSLKPALVVVELGGNDFLAQVPREQVFSNLETIITRCQSRGAAVLLLGMQSGLAGDRSEPQFRAVARRTQAGYVPNIMAEVMFHPDLKFDQIHPNDAGYEIVANQVEPQLRFMLQRLGRLKN